MRASLLGDGAEELADVTLVSVDGQTCCAAPALLAARSRRQLFMWPPTGTHFCQERWFRCSIFIVRYRSSLGGRPACWPPGQPASWPAAGRPPRDTKTESSWILDFMALTNSEDKLKQTCRQIEANLRTNRNQLEDKSKQT